VVLVDRLIRPGKGAVLGGIALTAWSTITAPISAQSDVAFPPEVYAARRARLAALTDGAPVIVPGADLTHRGLLEKQDPNFWYLTGVESPFAVLVMVPRGDSVYEALFLPERFQFAGAQFPLDDPRWRQAAWNQPIRRLSPGPESARVMGVDVTFSIDELAARLPDLIGDVPLAYVTRGAGAPYTPSGLPTITSARAQLGDALTSVTRVGRWQDATPLVERMRLIKDSHEIAALRRAAAISSLGLLEAMRAIRPGMNDREVAGLMEYVWKREGSPQPAFGPIVSSGAAAISLYSLKSENYNSTDHVMQDGELVFIDYGAAEFRTYGSDICRTFPVSGRFTPEQRHYYEIVLEAQDSALAVIRPGVMMLEVIRAAARVYRAHGLHEYEDIGRMGPEHVWGVMPSPTFYLIQDRGLTDYSGVQGTGVRDLGHHIGIEATDSRDYSLPLQPGMVFTVEPKLYIPDQAIAIMIEDMIVVTEDGYENLSVDAPRRVDQIERIMAR